MEYVYAALILNEADVEINEDNLTNVIDAAGVDVVESRVKALIAALEDVDIDEAVADAAAVPATGAAPASGAIESGDQAEAVEETSDVPDTTDDDDDEEEEASGEGLGELFG